MKQKKNRFKVERLFIFGAGASYSASSAIGAKPERQTPLDKDFCERIERINSAKPIWVQSSQDYVLKEWKDHTSFNRFGLEQAIILQLGHLEFIDAIHPRRRTTSVTDFQWLNKLSHLICFILRKGREAKEGPYQRFVKKVFQHDLPFDKIKDRVVTFNYDEMLDAHLIKRFGVKKLYFDQLKETQAESDRRDELCDHPLLIKLHGSVNWRCSRKEFERIVRPPKSGEEAHFIDSVWYSRVGTPSPDDDASPLIMPPLPIKPITQIHLFRFLWTKAYEYLHEANELVICGYSLPDADRLAHSLFSNFTNKTLKRVTIIDPNPVILKKWRELLKRKSVARRARWMYYEDFGEYVDDIGRTEE